MSNLEAGVAAHHAGLVPAYKEVVEDLFSRGLGQACVRNRDPGARNQHARPGTVVLDKLSKYTGDGHELLLPGEYTQLTGLSGQAGD